MLELMFILPYLLAIYFLYPALIILSDYEEFVTFCREEDESLFFNTIGILIFWPLILATIK